MPPLRILITGATGLLGRRLVLDRIERGDRVVVVSRLRARAASLFSAAANPAIEVVEGDPEDAAGAAPSLVVSGATTHIVVLNLSVNR